MNLLVVRNTNCSLLVLALIAFPALADGPVVNKLYHPYIDALENEIEYRGIEQDTYPGRRDLAQVHHLSIGRSLGDNFFAEFNLIGAKNRAAGFETEAWELEFKWQLTEQGEYPVDWGLLFEYEDERKAAVHEATIGLLAEKEMGQWSTTANFMLISEWGDAINDEVETQFNLQARYRYSRLFEPGIELYAGQGARGIGPVVQGTVVTGQRKSVHWEAGFIAGVGHESPDKSWRFLLEYEF